MKWHDIEDWMNNHQLPYELVEHVKHFDQYKSMVILGVNKEKQMQKFPMYFHHDIKQHLCLDLVRLVSAFVLWHFVILC
jgi:cyclic nucleotide gated channel